MRSWGKFLRLCVLCPFCGVLAGYALPATNDVVTLEAVVVWGEWEPVRSVRAADEIWRDA